MPHATINTDKFWNKVDIKSDDECWPWLGARKPTGYGNTRRNNKWLIAHRVSFTLTFGEIPKKTLVLHSCDNPPCCNPRHLSLGTNKKNSTEMVERGRCQKGEQRHNAKLQWFDILNIRTLYATGRFYHKDIAEAYGVCSGNVGRIVLKDTWKHVQ